MNMFRKVDRRLVGIKGSSFTRITFSSVCLLADAIKMFLKVEMGSAHRHFLESVKLFGLTQINFVMAVDSQL